MWCMQNFALIKNNEVKDIIVCDNFEVANQLAKNVYGDQAQAQDVTRYPLAVGDEYKDGKFYRFNEEVLPYPTVEERLTELRALEIQLEEATCDIGVSYEQRLSDIEEALCELSSMNGGTNNGENLA